MTVPDTPERSARARGAGVMLIAPLVAIYIVSQLLRSSLGVIAPDLAAELEMSAVAIGLLSSIFFITFAAVQIPLGMALDRFGPRVCLLVGAAITVTGTVMFALARSQTGLMLARALMGIGTAGSLMAPLAAYSRHFPPHRFAALAGLQLSLGTTGTLIATAPLGFSAAVIGWRASFLVIAAATCGVAAAVFFAVKDDTGAHHVRAESFAESVAGIGAILRMPSVGRLFVMNFVVYSSFGLIAALWGGPYLAHVYRLGLEERGALLVVPVLAQIIGSAMWGAMDRFTVSYKRSVTTGAILTALSLAFLAWRGALDPWMLAAWLFFFGLVSAYSPPLLTHGKALFPSHQIGRGLTLLNIGSMGGAFLTQALSGAIIEAFPPLPDGSYELRAYQVVFGLQALLIILALLVYFPTRDPE